MSMIAVMVTAGLTGGSGAPPLNIAALNPLVRYVADDVNPGATSWPDRVGGLTQTPGTAPVRLDGAYNGKKAIRFTAASSQYLQETAAAYLAAGVAFTLVAVYRAAWASSTMIFTRGDALWLQSYRGYSQIALAGVGQYNPGHNADFTNPYLTNLGLTRVIWRYLGAGVGDDGRVRLRANGVDQEIVHVGAVPAALSFVAGSQIGRGLSGAIFADGDLLELYILPEAVSDEVATAIDNDLVRRYSPKLLQFLSDSNGRGHGTNGADTGRFTSHPAVLYGLAGVASGGTDVRCHAVDGKKLSELLADLPSIVLPYTAPAYSRRTSVIAAAANDIASGEVDGAGALLRLDALGDAMRAEGFTNYVAQVLVNEIGSIAVGAVIFEAQRLVFNAGLQARVDAGDFAGIIPVADDPRLSNCNNATYFQGDKGHLTEVGQQVYAEVEHTTLASRF